VTIQLTWSEATARHRAALSCFTCTEPGKSGRNAVKGWSKEHPRFWELDVQNMVRSYRPPHRHSKVLLVGEDADGIGAVSAYEELDGPAHIRYWLSATCGTRTSEARRCVGVWAYSTLVKGHRGLSSGVSGLLLRLRRPTDRRCDQSPPPPRRILVEVDRVG
jgi:hypothetical protein